MTQNTQWHNFIKAMEFYTKAGFSYTEVPWAVSLNAIETSLPSYVDPDTVFGLEYKKYLVGSAEQSFIELMLQNKLQTGKYMALTPCFRNETEDELHKKYFMKLELIDYVKAHEPSQLDFKEMLETSHEFFKSMVSIDDSVTIQKTSIGSDIEINGIEVGSYGTRSFARPAINVSRSTQSFRNISHSWIYGTGLAEPRFTLATAKNILR